MTRLIFIALLVLCSSITTANAADASKRIQHQRRIKGSRMNPKPNQQIRKLRALKDDEKDGLPKKRDCKLKTKDNRSIEYECTAESNDDGTDLKVKDKIKFRIDTSDQGTKVQVEYTNKVEQQEEADSKVKEEDTKPDTNVSTSEDEAKSDKDADEKDTKVVEEVDTIVDTKSKEEKEKGDMRLLKDDKTSTETKTEYEIIYDSIIEYTKGNQTTTNKDDDDSEAYDFENDIVLQTLSLNDWVNDMGDNLMDDGTITYFTSTTTDGIVQFNYTISRMSDDAKLSSNRMKIDMTIMNFPWKSKTSYIALLSSISSQQKVKVKDDNDNDVEPNVLPTSSSSPDPNQPLPKKTTKKTTKVDISFDDALDATNGFVTMGEYTWDKSAKSTTSKTDNVNSTRMLITSNSTNTTTGTTTNNSTNNKQQDDDEEESDISVVATTYVIDGDSTAIENDGEQPKKVVAFSFIGTKAHHARKLYWDPEAGISYLAASSSVMNNPFFGLIMIGSTTVFMTIIHTLM